MFCLVIKRELNSSQTECAGGSATGCGDHGARELREESSPVGELSGDPDRSLGEREAVVPLIGATEVGTIKWAQKEGIS